MWIHQLDKKSEKQYLTIVEKVSDVIFQLNPERVIIFSILAFQFFGYDPSEVIGQPIEKLIDSKDLETALPKIATKGVGPLATMNLEVNFRTNQDSTLYEEMKIIKLRMDAFDLWGIPH